MPGDRIFQNIGRRIEQKPVQNFVKGIEAMAAKRLAFCHECPHWDARFRRCRKCGCFTSAKARLPQAKCPISKWGSEGR